MTHPDQRLEAAIHELRTLRRALLAKGVLTEEDLSEPPPEYSFIQEFFNRRQQRDETC